jgi:hypothetical protein
MSRIGNYPLPHEFSMTYNEATENCLNVAAQFGIESEQYKEAQHEMLVAGRRWKKSLTKTERVINFLNKIQWLLKRKKY